LAFEPAYRTATLKSYFDVNANVGFKYSDRLTALETNNITNNATKWQLSSTDFK
jgi:hypothetical protein